MVVCRKVVPKRTGGTNFKGGVKVKAFGVGGRDEINKGIVDNILYK